MESLTQFTHITEVWLSLRQFSQNSNAQQRSDFHCKHFCEKITRQHCVGISYTQFHQNQLNMEVQLELHLWLLSKYYGHWEDFHMKLMLTPQNFVKNTQMNVMRIEERILSLMGH